MSLTLSRALMSAGRGSAAESWTGAEYRAVRTPVLSPARFIGTDSMSAISNDTGTTSRVLPFTTMATSTIARPAAGSGTFTLAVTRTYSPERNSTSGTFMDRGADIDTWAVP